MMVATKEVMKFLPDAEDISKEHARKIIQRYTAAIEGNFLTWMGAGTISARSVISKFAIDENLWVEIRDNHPGMLRRFSRSCKAEPNSDDFRYVEKEVNEVRKIIADLSGIKIITLMATLENTSAAFIPFLAQLGRKLGCEDFTYTDVHGKADIKHANQFLEALSDEQQLGYKNTDVDIDNTIKSTIVLLKRVFTI
jgi:hypothetical protein